MNTPQPNRPDTRSGQVRGAEVRWVTLIRPLLWALLITLLIFGAYEVVERVWFTGAEMQTLHLFHMLRGISSTLFVAGVVGWMILRTSPAFLESPAPGESWTPETVLTEAERTVRYARWFIAMRWIAVLLAGILVFISVQLVKWLPEEVWWPLAGMVIGLAVCNLAYLALLRRGWGAPALLPLQAYIDLAVLATLLHFSGGIENPLSMMMLFHVIIAGIVLSRRQCYRIAAVASLMFALMAWAEWADLVEHYTLQLFPHFQEKGGETFHLAHHSLYVLSRVFLQAVVMFLSAYFVTTLAERLHENERWLAKMANRAMAGQQLLEQALETTGAGLRVLNDDLKPYWANTRWNEWFSSPPIQGCKAFEQLNGVQSPARQTLEDGQVRVTELALKPAGSGSETGEHVFLVTTAPSRDGGGRIQQVVELAQDITQQKRTQIQMLRAGRLAAVGELAGQIAHEVNNPMAIISAKARLLLSDHRAGMSPKTAQELGKITDLADRVARIAQGLLSYCRPSPTNRAKLDVRQPIRKSLALVEEHARSGGVVVQEQLQETLPFIEANTAELEQVFLNLFLNALDAMPEGGVLTVSAETQEAVLPDGRNAVAVSIIDTGVGIPEAVRDQIFEPFFTTKQEGRGTGLGLSICQGLVRSHGGVIDVQSHSGQGTRITVKLPAATETTEDSTDG